MEKHSFEEHRQSLAGKFEKRRTLYTIYFSPTGGTKKVADIVSRALSNERENGGWEMKEIDLSPAGTDYSQYHFTREDICIVAAPSFGGRVPGLVLERLKEMEGGHAKTILAAVYGNRAFEDTLLELEDTLVLAGFDCKAAVAAVAEHSIMHQFGQGRPDAEDEKELAGFAARIRERLEKESGGQEEAAGVLQGNRRAESRDSPETGRTESMAACHLSRKRTIPVPAAVCVRKNVRPGRYRQRNRHRLTRRNVSPACVAFQSARAMPEI